VKHFTPLCTAAHVKTTYYKLLVLFLLSKQDCWARIQTLQSSDCYIDGAEVREQQAVAQSATEELIKLRATLQQEQSVHEDALRHLRHALRAEGTLRVKEAKLGAQAVEDALARQVQVCTECTIFARLQ
jgi:hypothetical protein